MPGWRILSVLVFSATGVTIHHRRIYQELAYVQKKFLRWFRRKDIMHIFWKYILWLNIILQETKYWEQDNFKSCWKAWQTSLRWAEECHFSLVLQPTKNVRIFCPGIHGVRHESFRIHFQRGKQMDAGHESDAWLLKHCSMLSDLLVPTFRE